MMEKNIYFSKLEVVKIKGYIEVVTREHPKVNF